MADDFARCIPESDDVACPGGDCQHRDEDDSEDDPEKRNHRGAEIGKVGKPGDVPALS